MSVPLVTCFILLALTASAPGAWSDDAAISPDTANKAQKPFQGTPLSSEQGNHPAAAGRHKRDSLPLITPEQDGDLVLEPGDPTLSPGLSQILDNLAQMEVVLDPYIDYSYQKAGFVPGDDDDDSLDDGDDFDGDDEKRSRLFVGKRQPDEKRSRLFVGKRQRLFVGKRPRLFVGKRQRIFVGKRPRDFVGKRQRLFVGKRPRDFVGKRQRIFVGKRPRYFVGKRSWENNVQKRLREFLGKRDQMEADFDQHVGDFITRQSEPGVSLSADKRSREFIGKRNYLQLLKRLRAYVQKKPSRLFVGKRDSLPDLFPEEDKRFRYFVGKREPDTWEDTLPAGVNNDIFEDKKSRLFVGRRGSQQLEDPEEKRHRYFVGKRSREFVGKRSDQEWSEMPLAEEVGVAPVEEQDGGLEDEKRSRLFVGKRSGPSEGVERQQDEV